MAILPTKFVLRSPKYPQDEEYGKFCADSAKELAEVIREHQQRGETFGFDDANAFLGKKIQYFFVEHANEKSTDGMRIAKNYDQPRKSFTYTNLNASGIKYLHYAREAVLAHPEGLGALSELNRGKAVVVLDDRDKAIPLTEISRAGPPKYASALEKRILHIDSPRSIGNISLNHDVSPDKPEKYKAASEAFNEAMGEAMGTQPLTHSDSAQDATLKAYYIYSHIMPFDRYSSTAARILLEATAEISNLPTYHIAENRDINLEAIVNDWSVFKKANQKGSFWDKKASPADIIKYQKAEIAQGEQAGSVSRLEDFVHDALYISAMGDKAELFSNRRALIKTLMDKAVEPVPSYTDDEIKTIIEKHGVTRDLDEIKNWIHNPLTLQVGMVDYTDEGGQAKQARGISYQCKDFENSDIEFNDAFQRKYVHESFPDKKAFISFDHMYRELKESSAVLTEDAKLVYGKLRPFNEPETSKLKREFAEQLRKSKDGYIHGAPQENGRGLA